MGKSRRTVSLLPGKPYCCRATRSGKYFYRRLRAVPHGGRPGRTLVRPVWGLPLPRGETGNACPPDGFVHSVFQRVVNFYLGANLLSMGGAECGHAAAFLVLDLAENIDFSGLGLRKGLPVTLGGGWLRVGDVLAVDCRRAGLWAGRGQEEMAWRSRGVSWVNVAALGRVIARWGVKNGLGDVVDRHNPFFPVAGPLARLKEGLLGRQGPDLEAAVRGIMGYGPGLTPGGDDLLLGLLAATGGGVDYRVRREELYRAVRVNLDRTNEISASFLRYALAGDYHEYLQEVLYSVINGTPYLTASAVRRLLALGATSGTDIALGLYLGFSWMLTGDRRMTCNVGE